MTYVSLYRKWRPQTFADVVGQDHVVGTLVNAIQTGQVHHALLFSGTRGTGKTSTARILAKALNCERGPTPEPCNVCDACRSITDGTNLDVVEIDAASHGSVDDARDLRERASYAPAAARFKVYIVDEAHMVTPQGFNAMLKVLEEPPEHVRFVFCTTEPHKVIEAIRSRCQRHDFRRVGTAVLAEYFAKICAAEGVEVEPAAIEAVARAADGSVRDGESRLDQVLTFTGGRVTLADVARALGAVPAELRFELADALANQRPADVFACVEQVVDAGHDLQQFAREALEHLRDLYVLGAAPESTTLVDVTPETRERLAVQAERFGPGELARVLRVVGDVYLDLRTATDQRLVLEVGLARAAMPEASLDAEALLARIERLERRLAIASGDQAPASASPAPAPALATHAPGPTPATPTPAGRAPTPATPAPAPTPAGRASTPAAPAPGPASSAAGPDSSALGPAAPIPAEGTRRGKGTRRAEAAERPAETDRATAAATDDWDAPPPPPAAPVDLDLVSHSWGPVFERVQTASRMTASLLERGRLRALEGRQVVVEFSPQDRFYAEALEKGGRLQLVDAALEAVLGGGLGVRVVIGESVPVATSHAGVGDGVTAPEPPPPPPPEEEAARAFGREPAAEFEIDPDNDEGQPLDSDADTRAVADWAARELGGQVIEERRNDPPGRRAKGARDRAPSAGGEGRTRGQRARERSERGKR
jgi:DNA polymerase III subunit gamma/tau